MKIAQKKSLKKVSDLVKDNDLDSEIIERLQKNSSILFTDPVLKSLCSQLKKENEFENIRESNNQKQSNRTQKIYLTELKSLSPKQVSKLNSENYYTLEDVSGISVHELKELLATTENKSTQILKEVRKSLPSIKILNAVDLIEEELLKQYIPTGCKELDKLLGGRGIPTGALTEVYGQFRTGKSQLAYSAIIRSVLPKPFGLGGSALILDCEKTANIRRLYQIASYYSNRMPIKEILKNIYYCRTRDVKSQINTIKTFLEYEGQNLNKLTKAKKEIKLVVVDSLTYNFRTEYTTGRGCLAERQQKLMEHLKDLSSLSDFTNCAILLTNEVIANPDPYSSDGAEKAVGGHAVGHHTSMRIWFKKRRSYHLATMVDAPHLPDSECLFKISRRGLVDVDCQDYEPYEFKKNKTDLYYVKDLLSSNHEFLENQLETQLESESKDSDSEDESSNYENIKKISDSDQEVETFDQKKPNQ